jgi:antitoxin (DNA-binding transcriptional repressor) of toxin-antitoxin stability system
MLRAADEIIIAKSGKLVARLGPRNVNRQSAGSACSPEDYTAAARLPPYSELIRRICAA